jgi:hypothetical protein
MTTMEGRLPWRTDETGRAMAEPVFPRIELTEDEGAEIWMGMRKIARLEAGQNALVNIIYQHMLEDHGEDEARIYLTGVVHGLREAMLEQLAETTEAVRESADRGAEILARTRAFLAKRRYD